VGNLARHPCPMRIRRATVADAPAMAEGMKVVVDEGRWLATPAGTEARFLADRFARAIEDDHALFVLDDGDRIAGCLGLHPSAADGVLELGMWLLPDVRGRGHGRRLVEAALEEAVRRGAHKVQLEVYPDNPRGVALYAATGFEVEGVRRDHYRRPDGSLRSAIVMARLLG